MSKSVQQGGITCGAIDEPRKSSKAIDKRVIINFRDKNVVIAHFCDKNEVFVLFIDIYKYIITKTKTSFLSRKRAITTFLSRKFMITRFSIAFEDFEGSSIASQVMPPWSLVVIGSNW